MDPWAKIEELDASLFALRAENERLRAVVIHAAACNPDVSGDNAVVVLRNVIKQARHALSA